MKCPYCLKEANIPDHAKTNMENYGGTVRVRAECCKKIIHVVPRMTFRAYETIQSTRDDWGR